MQYILQDLLRLPLKERLEIIERSIDTHNFEKGQESLLASLFERLIQLKGEEHFKVLDAQVKQLKHF